MNPSQTNRRIFIKGLGATAILIQIPFWQACQSNTSSKGVLPRPQQALLHAVLKILFPPVNHTPDINQINAEYHINRYLTNPLIDPGEQQFIINGIDWLNETAHEDFHKDFVKLKIKDQQQLIQKITGESWGESWLSKLLTLTFESLLLDPIYQVNLKETGWQWLHHQPGLPRPNKQNNYPVILKRKKEIIAITRLDQL